MAKNGFTLFIRKNLLYLTLAVAFFALSGVGIALLVKTKSNDVYVGKLTSEDLNTSVEEKGKVDVSEKESEKESEQQSEKIEEKTVIIFAMPVENGTITNGFTNDTVVFNPTLNAYTGHMGVDVFGEEDANVLCAYDGTVESIVTTYLSGTTITVNHGNGLKTVYNSIEVDENLKEGQRVVKGGVLGVVSTTNKEEYKSGAHLHFEVYENGIKVDPEKYILTGEK